MTCVRIEARRLKTVRNFAMGLILGFSALSLSGVADAQRGDRAEDRVDRREGAVDRAVDRGPIDRAEDRLDFRENRVDRRTGPYRPSVNWGRPVVRRAVPVPPPPPARRAVVVAPRVRVVRGVHIHRYYGPTIYGYGYYYVDDDAYPWLAFTAITLKLLDLMNEEQVRKHEQAQIEATSAKVGEQIYWEDEYASGSVTTLRQGANAAGEQCREFHQTVTIGGETEDAYGIACLQPDGAWRIVQ